MSTTRAALTDLDLQTLLKGPTEQRRMMAALKVCRTLDAAVLTDVDRRHAQEILRILAADAAELVRRALAVTLRASPLLPRDVALKLAADSDNIAQPVLNFSPAFTDQDLAEIVERTRGVKQLAVASRERLPTLVADALAEHGDEEAVRTAVANDNAQFSHLGLDRILDRFSEAEPILNAMACRKALPLSTMQRLVDLVSDEIREQLVARHGLSQNLAQELAVETKERATLDLVDQAADVADLKSFVSDLRKQERLTPSLLLRALAHGHMHVFEWGLAELAGVPHHRAWVMIHDAGPLGLRAVYDRAGLPVKLYPAFRAGVDAYHALEMEMGARDPRLLQRRMLERFLTQPQTPGKDDVNYLMSKLDRMSRRSKMLNRAA